MTPRILVTQPVHADVAERLSGLGTLDLHAGPEPLSPPALAQRLAGATAVIGFMTDRIDAEALRDARDLRIVACALKGFDNYDVEACTRAGVWVSIVPDLLTEPTAELAVGLAIGLGRHLRHGDAVVREGRFHGWRPVLYGHGLSGSTVAVLGMGCVGRAIAERLRGFGCRLLGVDRTSAMPAGVEGATLATALDQADLLILALPLTDSTLHLIGEREIARSKRGALWVNVGRGSVVDEAAMARHLATGQAGGYAADVFECEDWGLPERPNEVSAALRAQASTLFTPHLGSAVTEVRRAIEHRAVDNVEAVLKGLAPGDAINRVGLRA
jgi:phosphonate dehydrogenase